MKLPNGKKAILPPGKLEEYCLNPFHPDGKHKARVFSKALDIHRENRSELEKLVFEAAELGKVTRLQESDFGKIYRVEHEVQGIHQKEVLCTLWIIRKGEDIPNLTSCFIKTKRTKQ